MRYYYERPEEWTVAAGFTLSFFHPLYNKATVYISDEKGIAVVQQRFNSVNKVTWWGPIDPWLIDDIASRPGFNNWFMKLLKREIFEDIHWR